MSFGKRQPGKPSAPLCEKSAPKIAKVAMGCGLLILALMGVGVYHNWIQLLKHFHPRALISVRLDRNAQQLEASWNQSFKEASRAAITVSWSMMKMAELCGDQDTMLRQNSLINFVTGLSTEDLPINGEGQNLYGDSSISAAEMASRLARHKERFCKQEYFVAIYDGRIAGSGYNQIASAEQDEKAHRLTIHSRALANLSKMKSVPVSGDEAIAFDCLKHHEDNVQEQHSCFWRIKELRASVLKGDSPVATELIREKFQSKEAVADYIAPIAAHVSYSSPDVDVRESCKRVHGSNYQYRDICERNQEEARARIRQMSVPDEIARYCDGVHKDSYVYRKICYENQLSAKEKRGY
jgi:hypothetical protein